MAAVAVGSGLRLMAVRYRSAPVAAALAWPWPARRSD